MSQGKVISFINMKGGVGKTTLCINIAYTLANHFDKKVLLVDIDPQFNATQSLFTKFKTLDDYSELRDKQWTINGILQPQTGGISSPPSTVDGDTVITRLFTTKQNDKNGCLDMIPGDLEIVSFESSRRGSEGILEDFISEKISVSYDYILIDTPATYSIYSQSALLASDYYIVPIAPDAFSVLGYDLLSKVMSDDLILKKSEVKELGIIFTLFKEGKVGRENIGNKFEKQNTFSKKLIENEYIKTGKMESFMYDMISTKDNIVEITEEFIQKLEEV
ncbi:ParA family protein [Lactococcus petauri]|uniref:ParA family protein n=1 Tax=Lactococcus petauri TaxID=1940789 RepID=UPI00030502EA|nr:AAA family ATPase [Lactococcus petauri]APC44679.1 hypothetical protein [Lactococcus phage PLg-TB25]MDT2620597.1 AAA family ATPase [Lactococcus petauri]